MNKLDVERLDRLIDHYEIRFAELCERAPHIGTDKLQLWALLYVVDDLTRPTEDRLLKEIDNG